MANGQVVHTVWMCWEKERFVSGIDREGLWEILRGLEGTDRLEQRGRVIHVAGHSA